MMTGVTQDPEGWLQARGFGIIVEQRDGHFWAHLTDVHGTVIAPDYGRGDNEAEAVDERSSVTNRSSDRLTGSVTE